MFCVCMRVSPVVSKNYFYSWYIETGSSSVHTLFGWYVLEPFFIYNSFLSLFPPVPFIYLFKKLSCLFFHYVAKSVRVGMYYFIIKNCSFPSRHYLGLWKSFKWMSNEVGLLGILVEFPRARKAIFFISPTQFRAS